MSDLIYTQIREFDQFAIAEIKYDPKIVLHQNSELGVQYASGQPISALTPSSSPHIRVCMVCLCWITI